MAEGLAANLRAGGHRCTLVRPGGFSFDATKSRIDPVSPADYQHLLDDLRSAAHAITGVVHAWSLDTEPLGGMSAAELIRAQERGTIGAMLLAQALVKSNLAPRLWLVTRGGQQADSSDDALSPAQAPMIGLAKAVSIEHPELRCVSVDLDPKRPSSELTALAAEFDETGIEAQVAFRNGERREARLARRRGGGASTMGANGEVWRLVPSSAGELEEFRREPIKRRSPGPQEVEIAVEAVGLNFKDVLSVLGLYPGDPGPLGGECAGRVTAVGSGVTHVSPGDDVLAVAGGSFASHVVARADLVQARPSGMSAEEGCSFPIAFLTADFCLSHLAGMRKGDRVLIHSAAGGVGMAAVQLAQNAGAEVFATAGSAWKRALLHTMGVTHVFDSRNISFAEDILAVTGGYGVDLVLNSLSGELIDASFRTLARGGRFVEIGKRGIKDPAWVAALDRDLHYFLVDWGETAAKDPALIGGMLTRLVDDLRRGTLKSLPRHVFGIDECARAFRFMAQARHAGKIVVRQDGPTPARIRRDGTYLVTGGLSGLGLLAARWLAERGAGRLVLIGRRRVTPELTASLDDLKAAGTDVAAHSIDVTDDAALNTLLGHIREVGQPLRGVMHCAGVLDDAAILQQDAARFAKVLGPKVSGAWALDRATRCDPLDWFVMFSSAAAVLGSAGQANHSAANAFLDLLARARRTQGLPGLSINWGPWAEVGAAADRDLTGRLAMQGLRAVTPKQGLFALERLLEDSSAQVAVLPIDWQRFVDHARHAGSQSFLAEVLATDAPAQSRSQAAQRRSIDLHGQLADAPAARRRPIVAAFVRERVLRALGLDPGQAMDPQMPLGDMGLDSLLSVELRNTLSSDLGASLPAILLFDYPTIDALTEFLMTDVLNIEERTREIDIPPSPVSAAALAGSLDDLSDDEVDRLLAARVQRTS